MTAPSHELTVFPSGLRLVTIPMPSAKTATVLTLVDCGSRYEARAKLGISHFLEHMMFKGTARRPGYLDISRELEAIGASYNAFTGKEVTGYYAKAAATKLDTILDVVFDIFLNSKLEQEAMEIERGPIIEELRMRRDDPAQHIGRLFEELLYGDQPAGWDTGGTDETIRALMAPDLRQWFDERYIATNTVIAVAGGIEAERVKAKVAEAFSGIRQGVVGARQGVVESQSAPAIKAYAKDVEQLYALIGVRSFGMFDERRYALALLASIMGGGMSSRLFDEIRSKRGLAYHIEADTTSYLDSGYFYVWAGLNQGKAQEGLRVILAELARVAAEGVTEEELRRVKDQAEGRMAFMLESTNGTANDYSSSVLFHGRVLTPEEELAKLMAVSNDQVQAVARDLFRDERLNLAVIGPKATEDDFRATLSFSHA